MWVKQRHKPPMSGNGEHTTYKNDWGMVPMTLFYPQMGINEDFHENIQGF